MTDAIVTPLRPSRDVTGPLRSRRAREKRKASIPAVPLAKLANQIKADDTVRHAPTPAISHGPPWSVWPLAGTTVGLMAASRTCQTALRS